MSAPITYLFDPFCGWCYGAAPQIARLRESLGDDRVQGLPVGLFAGDYARPMDGEFRDYAWSNDQRIASMTGQQFSQAYFDKVLSDFETPLDSGPPTRAFAVADLLHKGSGLALLDRMQRARFVEGRNPVRPRRCSISPPNSATTAPRSWPPTRDPKARRHTRPRSTMAISSWAGCACGACPRSPSYMAIITTR